MIYVPTTVLLECDVAEYPNRHPQQITERIHRALEEQGEGSAHGWWVKISFTEWNQTGGNHALVVHIPNQRPVTRPADALEIAYLQPVMNRLGRELADLI